MKFKRFLSLFFVVLLAVCIPCAFLAGCNGNSGDDGTDGNTSDNDSNGDKTGSGDEIFTEGMTLAQLRAATENIDNFTMEGQSEYKDLEGYIYNDILKINEKTYYQYGESEKAGEMSGIYEYIHFTQGECRYNFDYNCENNISKKTLVKSLLTYVDVDSYKISLWECIEIYFTDGETGLEVNEDEITYSNFQVASSYVRLKGSVLEYGWTAVGKAGTSYEGETEQYDIKIYGVNATVVDTSKIQSELADAEWADRVSYNGYSYRKAVDKDGNEYYYVYSYSGGGNGAEETINTLPVKPRES